MTFGRTPVTVLELQLDSCNNKYGAAPCTAGTEINAGTSQAGAADKTIVLAAGASAVDGFYDGKAVTVAGRLGIITAYAGAARTATVDRRWPTNGFRHSENFEDAAWIKLNSTITANVRKAPNGLLEMDKIADSATAGIIEHDTRQAPAFAYTVGQAYTVTAWFAPGEYQFGYIDFPEGRFPNGAGAYFDLVNGTVTKTDPPSLIATIKRDNHGTFRCSATEVCDAAGSAILLLGASLDGQGKVWEGTEGSGVYIWGAQVEALGHPGDYIATEAAAIGLPDGVAYRVLEVGGECYNAFRTCQDRDNYARIVKPIRFADEGATVPLGQEIRPTITRKNFATTKIDLEKGLARRGLATFTLKDESGPDTQDPYFKTRVTPAGGTYWSRTLARTPNYSGRGGMIRRAYLTSTVAGVWDPSEFVEESYIIEEIKGPDSSGRVQVSLKDPVKLADRQKLPAPSDGDLAAELTETDLSLSLDPPGIGADYPAAGYVRVGSEIIQYTGNAGDVLSWPDLSFRGSWGTEVGTGAVGGAVQLCKVWVNTPATEVLREMLEAADVPSGSIDLVGFAAEEQEWLGDNFNVTTNLSAPEAISRLLSDLLGNLRAYMWWSPGEQLVKFRVFAPESPASPQLKRLTEDAEIVEGSVRVERLDDLRSTLRTLYYELKSAVANRKEPASYLRARLAVDRDAEDPREYGDRRIVDRFSRWWDARNDIGGKAVVGRALGYYRDPPLEIQARVSAKDTDIIEGDQLDIEIGEIADFEGRPVAVRTLVLKRTDRDGEVGLVLRSTRFGRPYGFIAPPGGAPGYAVISPPNGADFADGTPPWIIF